MGTWYWRHTHRRLRTHVCLYKHMRCLRALEQGAGPPTTPQLSRVTSPSSSQPSKQNKPASLGNTSAADSCMPTRMPTLCQLAPHAGVTACCQDRLSVVLGVHQGYQCTNVEVSMLVLLVPHSACSQQHLDANCMHNWQCCWDSTVPSMRVVSAPYSSKRVCSLGPEAPHTVRCLPYCASCIGCDMWEPCVSKAHRGPLRHSHRMLGPGICCPAHKLLPALLVV